MILIGKLSGSDAEFFGAMKTLHRSLFLGSTGRMIVGTATLLLIIEIITGYWLWYDVAMTLIYSARRRGAGALYGLRQSLSWTRPNLRYGLHVGPGIWAGIPLLLMAVTGLTWSFQWWNDFIYLLFDPTGEVNTFHTIHSLHVGSFLGKTSRIIWLIVALLGASLPLSGLAILIHRPAKKK
ncbi:MAG: PepSY domain-containing protein [Muribaculaceae bacterium]|nr:PepSY domain-containing protein [Muribaculaceae bacterium]